MLVTKRLPKWSLPLLVFAAALAVRLAVIVLWNFDGLYGQDAFAYYDRSVDIAHRMAHGWAPLPPFFWPNGYPILGALAILVVGEGPIGPQMVNVLMGSALAALMFIFGRDLCRSCGGDEVADSPVDSGWMCGLIAGGCTVLAFGITGAVDHYTGAEVFELYNLDQQALARVSDGARPTLLVVNRGEIEKRWMGRPPGANLRWLERERTLNVAEEIGPWSISRVGRGIAASEGVK